ncbi:MAG: glycerol-3-phosphate 1-O-acyltransferase PlsY [Acidobacteriota bacterium]
MNWLPILWAGLLAAAYFMGSVSFSYLIVRRMRQRDVRAMGSGNAGATNVLRAAGLLPALATLFLDVTKGVLPVMAARALEAPPWVVAGSAIAVVVGHVFPALFQFRGGKGVATAIGALGALAPLVALAIVLVFVVVVALTRYVSLGSIAGAAAYPGTVYLFERGGWIEPEPALWIAAPPVALLILLKHLSNLRRLRTGGERPLEALWRKRGR